MKAAVMAAVLIALAAACGGSGGEPISSGNALYDAEGNYRGPTPSPTERITRSPTPKPPATPTLAPLRTPIVGGSRDNPLPIGQSQMYGATWEITVLNVTPDATDLVMAENSYNPPAPGNQFFIAAVSAKDLKVGSGTFNDYDLGAVGPSAVTYSGSDCGAGRREMPWAYTNGVTLGIVCWEIASADAAGLVMFYDPFSLGDVGRFYWDLSP